MLHFKTEKKIQRRPTSRSGDDGGRGGDGAGTTDAPFRNGGGVLVARRARNHRQKVVDDSADDRRADPVWFADLHARHRFTIDAAASAENALLPRFWTRADDALEQSWKGERVWCNPPYSRLSPWVLKAWREMRKGGCEIVIMLLPANRCEQSFWQRHIEPYRDQRWPGSFDVYPVHLATLFLPGRMRFGRPIEKPRPSGKGGNRPPFGCVLVRWSLGHRCEPPLADPVAHPEMDLGA